MKKGAILLLFLLSISLVPATMYECPAQGESDRDEVSLHQAKIINGLGIGLMEAEEVSYYNRITAELLIDARDISLSNSTTLYETVELKEDSYTVNLSWVKSQEIRLSVDGSAETVEIGESEKIQGLTVLVSDADSSDTISADLLVGKEKITLSSEKTPEEIIKIDGTEYRISLFSASDNNAIITVETCEENFTEKIQVPEEPEEEQNQDSEQENQTEDEQPEKQNSFIEEPQKSTGFLDKILNFFKSLFKQ